METVLIVVKGGLVQGASATSKDIKIIVQDLDNLPDAQEAGEGDCAYEEVAEILDEAGISARIAENVEAGA